MIDIIIPNFNGLENLKCVLQSLYNQTVKDFRVIIVDNGSTDASVIFVESEYKDIVILKNSSNVGFAKAVNSGIKFSGTTVASIYYLKGQELLKNSTGYIHFWQNTKLFAKIKVVDLPQYKLYNKQYQMIKVTETTNTLYANSNTRYSVISSLYTRNSKGTLIGQKTSGTSNGTEKINNKKVKYTGKIYITTKSDPKDLYNEKYIFGDYIEYKTSSSSQLLKTYPLEVINFS